MKPFLLLILFSFSLQAQHTISGTISPPENLKQVFLYKSNPSSSSYVDKGSLDQTDSFSITLDSTVSKGIYKIVYGLPTEEFNFDVLYNGKENIRFILEKGSLSFEESRENKLWQEYLQAITKATNQLNEFYVEGKTDEIEFMSLADSLKQTQQTFETKAQGTMVLDFIKGNKPFVPSEYQSIGTYFNHVREDFLKTIDFSNQYLQSSDFLTEKILVFIFDLVSNPDNAFYKEQVDRLVKSIADVNTVYKTTILNLIWQQFVAMENDAVANYITDAYLMQLAKDTNNQALLDTITTHKKISIGVTAPDFELTIDGNPTSLLNLKESENYLLVFWSSTCGHCLKELPQLNNYLKEVAKKDLTVIAFAIEDYEQSWKETIQQFPDFVHVLGLGKWDNPISKAYGVHATPSYFLLDKDKKIVAKPYDLEALESILNN